MIATALRALVVFAVAWGGATWLVQRAPGETPAATTPAAGEGTAGSTTSGGTGHLPVLAIDVDGQPVAGAGKVDGRLRVIEHHGGALGDLDGSPATLESPVAIETRGATSVVLPKKSYDVELRTGDGKDRDLPLLGLPADSDWALHGCGGDDTCLRNALAYELARAVGRYAPRTRFVEVVLDGEYQGLYLLVERIRRGRHRVDLPKPADDAAAGDITGGYIFKMELGEGEPGDRQPRDWVSPVSPMVYSYHYPRHDDITPAQKSYLQEHVAAFERMMSSSAWDHPERGYTAWIDVPSWVDFALIQELSNNIDAYQKSLYLQKWPESAGNKIALGPVWDFDNGFGSTAVREGRRTDVWAHHMNRFGAGEPVPYDPPAAVPHVPAYWERLWSDAGFRTRLRCRWRDLRAGPWILDSVRATIDRWTGELAAAHARNDRRWGITEPYGDRVQRLTAWLSARLSWMDANLPGACA